MDDRFIVPHINWTTKHGKVYCKLCGDKSKETFVSTARKSITFRKEHACCTDCMDKMKVIIKRYFEVNYSVSNTQAAILISERFGVEI
jgi:predicted membrane GTPase involved in stress response